MIVVNVSIVASDFLQEGISLKGEILFGIINPRGVEVLVELVEDDGSESSKCYIEEESECVVLSEDSFIDGRELVQLGRVFEHVDVFGVIDF
mgnify:CR=1 FL=1